MLRPITFRGKGRLLAPLVPLTGEKSAQVFHCMLKLDLGNSIERMVYMGCYEPLNTFRVKGLLRPGMTFVDVGANIGYFTVLPHLSSVKVGESLQLSRTPGISRN